MQLSPSLQTPLCFCPAELTGAGGVSFIARISRSKRCKSHSRLPSFAALRRNVQVTVRGFWSPGDCTALGCQRVRCEELPQGRETRCMQVLVVISGGEWGSSRQSFDRLSLKPSICGASLCWAGVLHLCFEGLDICTVCTTQTGFCTAIK